jgi:hypothetical protein
MLVGDAKAWSFVSLFQTIADWESVHTVYVQHLGAEASQGEQLRMCKKDIAEAFEKLQVCVARLFAHMRCFASARLS